MYEPSYFRTHSSHISPTFLGKHIYANFTDPNSYPFFQDEYDGSVPGGLQGVNALRAPGEDRAEVRDAVEFIEGLRQARDKGAIPVGRSVVVIGGGMTAVDGRR